MADLTRIATTFARLRERGHMAFMPFVTAGDPDVGVTVELIRELAGRGVDLIEVGFPYSDPIADGPVIQASYTRALGKGIHVRDVFEAIGSLQASDGPPLVAMVSYAIIFRHGPERFLREAAVAGFAGLIVPDLPGDEAGELFQQAQDQGLDLIQLIAPTSPAKRVDRILQACSGFVYCISVAGTTGVRDELPPALREQLKELRQRTELPLAVGFGISRPEQVEPLRGLADGIIVGSAIVRHLEALSADPTKRDDVIAAIGELSTQMLAATRA